MTFISTIGQSLDQIERLKVMQTTLADLQYQLSSGKKTRLFKGLETDVVTSQRARADFSSLNIYRDNITIADRRLKMMSASITNIKQQTENITNALEIQTQQGEFEMDSIADLAEKTYDFMLDLMNIKDGDRYLFGGAETKEQPVNNTGTIDTYTNSRIDDWLNGVITNDELIDSYHDTAQLTDTIVGYSAVLSSGSVKEVSIRVDDYTEMDYTVLANDEGFRNILAAVSMIRGLSGNLDEVTREADDPVSLVTAPGATSAEQNDNFYKVFNDVTKMLVDGIKSLEKHQFNLSQAQAQISQIEDSHALEQNMLAGIISDVEDVDINQVAVELNTLQTQLEASYRVTASVSQISLVNYI